MSKTTWRERRQGNEEKLRQYTTRLLASSKEEKKEEGNRPGHTFKPYSHGACAAMSRMSERIDVEGIVNSSFPAKTVKGMSKGRPFNDSVWCKRMIEHLDSVQEKIWKIVEGLKTENGII